MKIQIIQHWKNFFLIPLQIYVRQLKISNFNIKVKIKSKQLKRKLKDGL